MDANTFIVTRKIFDLVHKCRPNILTAKFIVNVKHIDKRPIFNVNNTAHAADKSFVNLGEISELFSLCARGVAKIEIVKTFVYIAVVLGFV